MKRRQLFHYGFGALGSTAFPAIDNASPPPSAVLLTEKSARITAEPFKSTPNGNEVSCAEFGAVPNCTAQGIGTDVSPAIRDAVNAAMERFGGCCRIVLPPGRYRASTPIVIDLNGSAQVTLDLQGSLTPDKIPMCIITVKNGFDVRLNANVLEGGIFDGWHNTNPYRVDYHHTADAVEEGGQEAFRIDGVFGCHVDLRAYAYGGRLLRTSSRSDPSYPQTGGLSGRIETRRHADLDKARVAQALWADSSSEPGAGNWGAFDRITCDYDYYGPVWNDLNDIEVATFDCAFATAGPAFRGCVVVEGNYWYVGDLDGVDIGPHVSFTSSRLRKCEATRVSRMRFLNRGVGLHIQDSNRFEFTVDHSSVSGSPFSSAVHVENGTNGTVVVSANGYGQRIALLDGEKTDSVTVSAFDQDLFSSDNVIEVGKAVRGLVILDRVLLRYADKQKARIAVYSQSPVVVRSPTFCGKSGYVFDLVEGNHVSLTGSHNLDSGIFCKAFAPSGWVLPDAAYERRARSLILEGSRSSGDGGSIAFGVADAKVEGNLTLAQIKTKVATAASGRLRGSLTMQLRNQEGDRPEYLDGLEISHAEANDETAAVLLVLENGRYVPRRVKLGAPTSEERRRVLYVDG